MTQFQESATVRTLGTPRASTAPFLAITAGLVVVLMALALISFVVAGRPADATIGGNTDTAAVDGYMAGLTAANNQHRIEVAQRLNDGWAASLIPQRLSPKDGWEAALLKPVAAIEAKFANGYPLHGGLAGPSRVAINWAGGFAPGYPLQGGLAGASQVDEGDASINRYLLPADQAAAAGSTLRFAPQPAEAATNGDNQRFITAD
jgi:hypothetical protein